MRFTYTSREDLAHPLFWVQCACLAVWLALALYLTHRFPDDASLLLFLLPSVGFFCAQLVRGVAFDFQGVAFEGTFFCCFFSPAIFGTASQAGNNGDLPVILVYIVLAMLFGFAFFRLMGKAFQRIT